MNVKSSLITNCDKYSKMTSRCAKCLSNAYGTSYIFANIIACLLNIVYFIQQIMRLIEVQI